MTEHEKRIREASNFALDNEWSYLVVENADLRALLADLDAVRGALGEIIADMDSDFGTGYDYDKARAALKGATA